ATLLLSQGVPMLVAGDAMGRTQHGNNNGYCQDNELSWLDWDLTPEKRALFAFTRRVVRLWRDHPVFRRRSFFQGRPIKGSDIKDILWLNPDGQEMSDEQWNQSSARCLGFFLSGDGVVEPDRQGRPPHDESFLVLLNAGHETIPFAMPAIAENAYWRALLDTGFESGFKSRGNFEFGDTYPLEARTLALLMLVHRHGEPDPEMEHATAT
ncbi:MAG: glycogen debranching protein GlgX, partial [Burkholderiales bacterium]